MQTETFHLAPWSWHRLFGLMFVLPAISLFAAGITNDVHWRDSEAIVSPWIIRPFATTFIVAGIFILFAKSSLIIDSENELLDKYWGLFFAFIRVKSLSFRSLVEISILKRTDPDNDVYFSVRIHYHKGTKLKYFEVTTDTDHSKADEIGRRLSMALNIPLKSQKFTEQDAAANP